ncbi:hypothetical protein JYU34_016062 [Plutella xylostella]|uniref:Uncharacterized protein n=1 Tax=Plutella xylostella TaxID=51655 RepID=A0ABQ7Q5B8_PLUXY|nr:hypothetical protein JYU34_016062 [Plutella xylostella]
MSPLLFNVATISICRTIVNVCISQYADDFVLYITSKHVGQAILEMQTALDVLNCLIRDMGLEISNRKTKVCLFSRGFRRNNVNLTINGQTLDLVDNVKYLGLWLDSSLRWGRHVNEVYQKTLRFLNVLKVLSGSSWGIHPKHIRRLYISIIRSRLDYSSFLYDTSCNSHLNKLVRVQNQAMRVIGGFIKSTPIHVMESELCLQPLHLRRFFLAGKFWLKAKSVGNNVCIQLITTLKDLTLNRYWATKKIPILVQLNNIFSETTIYSSPVLEMYTLDTWVTNIDLNDIIRLRVEDIDQSKRALSSVYMKEKCNYMLHTKYERFYKMYTDGSKEGSNVGCAFLDPQIRVGVKFSIDCATSIMNAELQAISECLSYIETIDFDSFVVLTDSRSALQHLARCTSICRGIPIAYIIISSIAKLRFNNKNIVLQWIPSHVGITGNEEVDVLAKQALSDGLPLPCLSLYSDHIHTLKEECYKLWKEHFDRRSVEKGIWYKTVQCSPLRYPWFDSNSINLSRRLIVTAMRLRSGHIPLNKFAFLMKKSHSPNCMECGMVEDVYHILMECVRNEAQRRDITYKYPSLKEFGGCNSALTSPLSGEAIELYKLAITGIRLRESL